MKIKQAERFAHQKFVELGMLGWYCHVFGEKMFHRLEALELMVNISRGVDTPKGRKLVGVCYNDGKSRWIALRRKYVLKYPAEKVQKIILHEIAHAIRGSGYGHDKKFRRVAKSLGTYQGSCVEDTK